MKKSYSQDPETWAEFWKGRNPYKELSLKDCYGERPYVLKYVPREGKVLEAGSGIGRIVFYLERLGIDIQGIDFSKKDVCQCRAFSKKHGIDPKKFIYGDILSLPFADNSLSGYLSFGVVEHFIEGPQKPLKEAFRTLRPGGILLVTTPNRFALHWLYGNLKSKIKSKLKRLIYFFKNKDYNEPKEDFWQYWYSKEQLQNFTEEQGFKTIIADNFGLKHALDWQIRSPEFKFLKVISPFVMKLAEFFDKTFIRNFSANSVVVAYKPGPNLQCFISGLNVENNADSNFNLPISEDLAKTLPSNIRDRYLKDKKAFFSERINYSNTQSPINKEKEQCSYCDKNYTNDNLIDLSFTRKVCLDCIKDTKINLELSNLYIKEKWHPHS